MNNRFNYCDKYNGWSNYPTWNYKLHIDNDYNSYIYWSSFAKENDIPTIAWHLEDELQETINDLYDQKIISPMLCDMFGWMTEMINYFEIAESLKNDWEE